MELKLKIEDQQSATLHSSILLALKIAAEMKSLERAHEVLNAHIDSKKWAVGQGGHHVWLSWNSQYGPVRVAVIEEVAS